MSKTSTFAGPLVAAASRVVLFGALTTVSSARSHGGLHVPQPPTVWRVQPRSGFDVKRDVMSLSSLQ